MAFRRRTRMISFRVSELEFEQLKNESESRGVGSVSDYARLSLCRGLPHDSSDPLEDRIHQLDAKVQTLFAHVERLIALAERTHEVVARPAGPFSRARVPGRDQRYPRPASSAL